MNSFIREEYYHFAAGSGVTGMCKPSINRGNISKAAAVRNNSTRAVIVEGLLQLCEEIVVHITRRQGEDDQRGEIRVFLSR